MADMTLVAPVYNVANYLRASVESMLAQTHTSIEIILVDDGSTDESGQICDEFAARDSRVRVIHQANAGTGAARNAGLDAATSKYIYFCDPDDLLSPALVADTFAQAEQHGADIVTFGYTEVRQEVDGRQGAGREHLPAVSGCLRREAFWADYRKLDFMTSLWTRVFRLDFLRAHALRSGTQSTGQDAIFLYDILAAPFETIVFLQSSYYIYLLHPASATMAYKPERAENHYQMARHCARMLENVPDAAERADLMARNYVVGMLKGMKNVVGCRAVSRKEMLRVLRHYRDLPENDRAFAAISPRSFVGAKEQLKVWLLKKRWLRVYLALTLLLQSKV